MTSTFDTANPLDGTATIPTQDIRDIIQLLSIGLQVIIYKNTCEVFVFSAWGEYEAQG